MIENEELLLNEIDGQLDYASTLIDLGKFDDSFKLCEEIRRNLDTLPYKSEIHSLLLFKLAGLYVDIGHMTSNEKATIIGLTVMESDDFANCITRDSYYYCLGNARRNLIQHKYGDNLETDINSLKDLSQVNSLFWKAILSSKEQNSDINPRYLTNMANNLKQQYRFSEALALYDQVIIGDIDIPQAWVNRSETLSLMSKINNASSIKQGQEIALGFEKASKSKETPPSWAEFYASKAKRINEDIENECLLMGLSPNKDNHLDKQEYQSLSEYRRWCLDSYLSLSEHGLYCKCYGSARDNLTIPLTTRGISGEFIYPMEKVLNRLKSEFGLARLMLYEYETSGIDEYLEDEACYSKLYDNELLGINIEKLRTAFRICFGILDKIGNAIAVLFDLQIKNKKNRVLNAPFHTFWNLNKQDRLDKFNSYDNAGLIGLYSIACDLNHNLQGELNFYKQWRNALEHSFVFIYEGIEPKDLSTTSKHFEEPTFISEAEFRNSAQHVLQLTRSAMFSFVYAVRIKAEKETPKEVEHLFQKKTMQRKDYVLNTES